MQNILKPSHLKQLCEEYGFTPSKKYGQNFLISQKPIDDIVEAGDLKKTDTVVEVGPGFGVLTFALAERVKKVFSFEIEKRLEPYWEVALKHENTCPQSLRSSVGRRVKSLKQCDIEMIWDNILNQSSFFSLQSFENYKVIANLPYQITSRVLRLFLEESENKPELIVVMVQKEVAERIIAKPGEMSLLSVSVQYYGTPKIISKVPKGSFWPQPKVDSAIIKIDNIKSRQGEKDFFKVVRAGFAHKRKQLWRNLSVGLGLPGESVKQVLVEVIGNEKVRAQELSVEEWKELQQYLFTVSP